MEEKVSIIIPVYNAEKFLEKCLDSIINQTYKNIEIICINDDSTDNSEKILKQYQLKDNRIIFKTIENGGLTRARNTGIKEATGEFFMFVDSDDYIESNMVEKMLNTINKEKADVVRCTNFLENQDGEILKIEDFSIRNKLLTKQEINEEIISKIIDGELLSYACVLMIRRETIFKTNLFNEKLRFLEDKAFFIDLILVTEKIYFLDIPLYHYMINEKSLTKSKKLVTRNMYNLIDGWNYTRGCLEKSRFSSPNILTKLNTRYLIGITGFLYETYKYNKMEFEKAYHDLINNENFKSIITDFNIQQFGIHIKISINLIIKHHYILLRIFYFIRKMLTKNREK